MSNRRHRPAAAECCESRTWLERLQVLFQVMLLLPRELQIQRLHVVLNDSFQRLRAPVVEVRRVLPESAEWCRAIPLLSRPLGVGCAHSGFRRGMESPVIIVGEGPV